MKVMLVPSEVSAPTGQQFLTSFLVNDTVAVDAGSIGFFADPQTQARVRHVLISHSHIDHLASLPILLDNTVFLKEEPLSVYGNSAVHDCLRRDLFNDRLWPDFFRLKAGSMPFLQFEALEAGQSVRIEGLQITAVEVNHVVPTLGFIIEDASAAVVFTSDTGPTDEIWQRANALPHLRAVFLEATFPSEMGGLADASKHFTTEGFAKEVQKVKPGTRLFAVHLKARFQAQVRAELQALGLPNLEVAEAGREYHF